jgi:nucleotide-binding universal stress UspA family protein
MKTAQLPQPRLKFRRRAPHMRAITRIVVPIDFSRGSLKAIPYALAISRRFGAEVHLIHVIDTTQYLPPTVLMWPAASRIEWNAHVRKELDAVALKFAKFGEITLHAPLEGPAQEQICQTARHLKADLIVIATHGYTGYKRAFLGSTAERVVQFSPCPVLVVRKTYAGANGENGWKDRIAFRLGKILVPIDFSRFSEATFDLGAALARDLQAKISLLHVLKPPVYPFGDRQTFLPGAAISKEMRKGVGKHMRAMCEKAGVRASVQVLKGSPAPTICEYAHCQNVDLIIISTHGRSGLSHVLIGSVAERVVRHAECPVLVVPRDWATNKQHRD